jgi:polyisoprenyl-phosphate glycosyltransferase
MSEIARNGPLPEAAPRPRGGAAAVTLSVVVPMCNEAGNLAALFAELERNLADAGCSYEIVCVNDGSGDDTLARLHAQRRVNPAVKIVNLSRNFGKEVALSAGLAYSRGEAVLPLDADLQDPPALIPEMLAYWRQGYDIVNAVRRTRDEGMLKRLGAHLFYRAYNALAHTPIPPEVGDFRLMDRRVIDVINQLPERTRFMKGLFAWVGFRHVEIPYDRPARRLGETTWSLRQLFGFAIEGITAFSTVPLRLATYLGALLMLVALVYIAVLVVRVVVAGVDVPGYASLMVTMLLFGAVQFTILGIIGAYVGRVYEEVKRRPLYVVEDTAGFDEPGDT